MLKNTQRTLGMFTSVFRAVALLLGAVGLISAGTTLFFVVNSESATGSVVDFEEVTNPAPVLNPGGTSSFHYAVIEFSTADDRQVRFQGRSGQGDSSFEQGDTVQVRYRPADPEQARIDSTLEIWATPLIFGGLFLVFGIIGVVAPFAFSDHRGNRQSVSPVWPENPQGTRPDEEKA
ncbi:MAG: DUF3592 domain-containing protein [Spirochaetia bacterium]